MPGSDLSAVARGELSETDRLGVLLEFVWEPRKGAPFYQQIWRGFRSKRYKYTVLGNVQEGLNPWQFFDLEEDPYELNNLIGEAAYGELIAQHHGWMKDRMIQVSDDKVRLLKTEAEIAR